MQRPLQGFIENLYLECRIDRFDFNVELKLGREYHTWILLEHAESRLK